MFFTEYAKKWRKSAKYLTLFFFGYICGMSEESLFETSFVPSDKPSKVLLLGNGIYRAFDDTQTWGNLLRFVVCELRKKGAEVKFEPSDETSYILYFDYLYTMWKKRPKSEENESSRLNDFTKEVSGIFNKWFDKQDVDDVKRINKMVWSHFNVVLTTNVDNRLENICDKGWTSRSEGKWKYSTYRRKINENRTIYYIHGSVSHKDSICFGLDHYLGESRNLYNGLRERKESNPQEKTSLNSMLKKSWLYYLFCEDVDIVGQGLDCTEVDLWWALEKRFQYKSQNRICNKVRFFMPSLDWTANRGKIEMLKALDVEVVIIHCCEYKDFYEKYFAEYAGANFIETKEK